MYNFLNPSWAGAECGWVEDQPQHSRIGDALRLVGKDTATLLLKVSNSRLFGAWSLKFIWCLVFGVWCFPTHV